jgi:hypothetical protein
VALVEHENAIELVAQACQLRERLMALDDALLDRV